MSSQPEDQLSPEERLLKVIQGEDSAGEKAPNSENVETSAITQTPSATSIPVKTPPRLRPRPLKPAVTKPPAAIPRTVLAEKDASAKAQKVPVPIDALEDTKGPFADPASQAPAQMFGELSGDAPMLFADLGADTAIPEDDPIEMESSKSPRQFGISIINTCIAALLMFAIVIIVAYEVVAAVQSSKQNAGRIVAGSLPPLAEEGERGALPDLQNMLASFRERGFLTEQTDDAAPAEERPSLRATSLKQYVQKYIVILGLSWNGARTIQEAILMDQSGSRMHIVKVGDEISLSDGTLKILRISDDSVVVHDGVEEIIIGKKKA